MSLVSFHEVEKTYRSLQGIDYVAVERFSVDIEAGEFFCLLGPSGCGKTTVLKMLAGFEAPTAGQILMEGRAVTGASRDRGVVFQGDDSLYGWLTAVENVEFGLRMQRVRPGPRRERAGDIALRGFRTPRHREGRADDTEAEDQCADLGRSRQETGSKQHGGNARDDDEPEGDDAARRGMPDGGDPHVCAPRGAVSASLVGALKKTPDPPHTAPRCGMGRRSGWAGYDARR